MENRTKNREKSLRKSRKREYVYNIQYTDTVIRGLRGLPLTRKKNVLHFAYLANPARVALYGKKEFADGKKGSL
jgi:hypothetical protein